MREGGGRQVQVSEAPCRRVGIRVFHGPPQVNFSFLTNNYNFLEEKPTIVSYGSLQKVMFGNIEKICALY